MTLFRPCVDLHGGKVKQIVGASLTDSGDGLRTNFIAKDGPEYFASLYRRDDLDGGHIIKLGPGNDELARAALAAWPGGLQIGGGITRDNAASWLDAGAAKVIVTSWLFPNGTFEPARLEDLARCVGREHVVIDLSCRRVGEEWFVATNRWQTVTSFALCEESFDRLARRCSEFLIHAADVEGLCRGIDQELVVRLGQWSPHPCTYAGGANDIGDLELVDRLSAGRVDLTYGSALDVFSGRLVKYRYCVAWNQTVKGQASHVRRRRWRG